ncbi:HNH endonuclease [Burkholderia pseudomallei]|uniref:HNH endonuclease n=1 Tax=Burkholderia pseudomallei TaxID=28450 RepID=UPI000AAEA841|nr:HNH endonuclease [Burkholderia pseudomallei]MBM5663839.1 hypothetical protein [Burkholderia pseudomallei]
MIERFLEKYRRGQTGIWTGLAADDLADAPFPDQMFHAGAEVPKADINVLWARWFVRSLFVASSSTARVVDIVREIARYIDERHAGLSQSKKDSLRQQLFELVSDEMTRERQEGRKAVSGRDREVLLDLAGTPCRCALCGYRFSQEAIDRFVDQVPVAIPLPRYVDFIRPSGLYEQDLRIEVDHKYPVSKGGGHLNNLQLLCGWCNGAKRDYTNIYECGVAPLPFMHPRRGLIEVPQPFWIVRKMVAVRACEHPGPEACTENNTSCELRIAPIFGGAMTPPNLAVFCEKHDPLRSDRLILPREYQKGRSWTKRRAQ